jgi:acyl-CoA dehydrogenase
MLSFPGPGLGGGAIAAAGTAEQKKKWLTRYNDGELRWGAMAYTEPGAGSDTGAIKTTAKRDGNSWVLNGRKIFCTNGASADLVVVWATLDASKGKEAIRAFVIEKGTTGFQIGHLEKKMGIRSSETAELILEDCRIPLDNILGELERDPKGFKGAMATFDMTRPGVAAMAVGIARAALEYLRDRLKEEGWQGPGYGRSRANLAATDDWMIEMEAQIEASRMLAHKAAFLLDQKQPNNLEASMAKAKAGTVVVAVCAKAVELLGPEGLTRKHPVEMWLRDSKVYDIFEGTGQVNRLVIARRYLGYTSKELQ